MQNLIFYTILVLERNESLFLVPSLLAYIGGCLACQLLPDEDDGVEPDRCVGVAFDAAVVVVFGTPSGKHGRPRS